jgi:hypothetical protein
MLKRFLALIGLSIFGVATASDLSPAFHKPYKIEAFNVIYNLAFCDNLDLFGADNKNPTDRWATLLSPKPDIAALRKITNDEKEESRLRVISFNRLRELNEAVQSKKLLGVIVEVGLSGGLDMLAAYPDGRIRYINHREKMVVHEASPPEVDSAIQKLMLTSQVAVNATGPRKGKRLPPPKNGNVRFTLISSEGMHLGESSLEQMQSSPMGAAIFSAASNLLGLVVEEALKEEARQEKAN